MKSPSTRHEEWVEFSKYVLKHIDGYCDKQYGEKGTDRITDNTTAECINQVRKYYERFGKNQRPGQQEQDFLKMAHYTCCAFWKFMDEQDELCEKNNNNLYPEGMIYDVDGKKFVNLQGKTYYITYEEEE